MERLNDSQPTETIATNVKGGYCVAYGVIGNRLQASSYRCCLAWWQSNKYILLRLEKYIGYFITL